MTNVPMINDYKPRRNALLEKSYTFALKIIELYKYLVYEKKEYVISRQILKSGTSIGANAEEADGAYSKKEFLSKVTISFKEAKETHFWLRLIRDSKLAEKKVKPLIIDCDEILRIITSIQRTTKINLKKV